MKSFVHQMFKLNERMYQNMLCKSLHRCNETTLILTFCRNIAKHVVLNSILHLYERINWGIQRKCFSFFKISGVILGAFLSFKER